jgi:alpha-amylase/alpha-mannosidase (GH57 family)
MKWINFLHCYQPANADAHIIKDATEKSYKYLLSVLANYPNIKFTVNITGCLFLRWEQFNYFDVIESTKKLIKNGQIEITGSAAYHPILPLLPEAETIRQIKDNEELLKKFLGDAWRKPKGFFMPEMAYSQETAKIIKSLGYEWIILDEIAMNGKLGQVNFEKIYLDENSGLKIIFRNRRLSKSYVPDDLMKITCSPGLQRRGAYPAENQHSEKNVEKEKIYITATDCELYGLRHIDQTGQLRSLLSRNDLTTLTISEYIDKKEPVKIKPHASSWESTEEELAKKQPYILWYDKKNPVHKKIWQLANLAYAAAEKFKNDNNYYWARWHLVRGLSSCTFWWASARDFQLFSGISWSPDEIERGTNELIRSIRSFDSEDSRQIKIKGEKLHIAIKQMIWQKHWTNYWKK